MASPSPFFSLATAARRSLRRSLRPAHVAASAPSPPRLARQLATCAVRASGGGGQKEGDGARAALAQPKPKGKKEADDREMEALLTFAEKNASPSSSSSSSSPEASDVAALMASLRAVGSAGGAPSSSSAADKASSASPSSSSSSASASEAVASELDALLAAANDRSERKDGAGAGAGYSRHGQGQSAGQGQGQGQGSHKHHSEAAATYGTEAQRAAGAAQLKLSRDELQALLKSYEGWGEPKLSSDPKGDVMASAGLGRESSFLWAGVACAKERRASRTRWLPFDVVPPRTQRHR